MDEYKVWVKEILEQKLKECRETLDEIRICRVPDDHPLFIKVLGHFEAHEKYLVNELKKFEREESKTKS